MAIRDPRSSELSLTLSELRHGFESQLRIKIHASNQGRKSSPHLYGLPTAPESRVSKPKFNRPN